MKVSALIFSKDDTKQAVELVRSLYGSTDEIVVMDASDARDKSYLIKETRGFERVHVFNLIALGFREPLMTYALTKCKNSWVLVLNTDEKPSEMLMKDLDELTSEMKHDAYSLQIYSVHSSTSRTFVSFQVRLFRKNKIEFRGLLHEQPLVHGNTKMLMGDNYYIEHFTTGMVHSTKGSYAEMERFQRFTYSEYNAMMLEMTDRAMRRYEADTRLSPSKKLLLAFLGTYEALGMKSQEQEVSNLDYFIFWLLRDIAHQARRRSIIGMFRAFPTSVDNIKEMKMWRNGPYGDEDFEIAKKINKIGSVKYLGLDKVSFVEMLNRKYKNKKQGIGLLISLLREKYEKEHGVAAT